MGQAGSVYTTDIDKHCESRLLYLSCGGLVAKSWQTLVTSWTVARQAPLSMGFSRQEYWNGLPFPPPGDLPDPGTVYIYIGASQVVLTQGMNLHLLSFLLWQVSSLPLAIPGKPLYVLCQVASVVSDSL